MNREVNPSRKYFPANVGQVTGKMQVSDSAGLKTSRSNEVYFSVETSALRVGVKLRLPIFDEQNVLLLAAGTLVRPSFLRNLRSRGIDRVRIHESELWRVFDESRSVANASSSMTRIDTEASRPSAAATPPASQSRQTHPQHLHFDPELLKNGLCQLPPQGEAFAGQLRFHGAESYDAKLCTQFAKNHDQAAEQMDFIQQTLLYEDKVDGDLLTAITEAALRELAVDPDLFVSVPVTADTTTYPAKHSLYSSMIAIAMGVRLGMDRRMLRELAIGCLVHDSGMLLIDESLYKINAALDPVAFLEVTKHPIFIFDRVNDISAVPKRSSLIAYQMHERCDGSGYPRRRKASQIEFLSKIAAVADVFTAMISMRPHRPAMLPYWAMERLIRGVHQGSYDALAVRALLQTVSLFPIGSHVELNNGRVGRVIRANGTAINRPVIEIATPGNLHSQPEIINLQQRDDLSVVRAVPDLETTAILIAEQDNWE